MLISGSTKYVRTSFDNEAEIENVVLDNAELLFGPYAIILSQARMTTSGGRKTVPDGIAIDLQEEQWYIIEAERAAHGTWEHIAPQVSRQLTAARHEATREQILTLALDIVKDSGEWAEKLEELAIADLALHGKIAAILKNTPLVAIPIDSIPRDLEEWINSVNTTVKIWIIEKYIKTGSDEILYSIPDDAVPDIDTSARVPESSRPTTPTRYFREVIEGGLLEPGQELFMEYGQRGHERQRFTAIVREEGLEVEGHVYSPSYAAVACMQSVGSTRTTANGWTVWKTASGVLLDALWNSLAELGEES